MFRPSLLRVYVALIDDFLMDVYPCAPRNEWAGSCPCFRFTFMGLYIMQNDQVEMIFELEGSGWAYGRNLNAYFQPTSLGAGILWMSTRNGPRLKTVLSVNFNWPVSSLDCFVSRRKSTFHCSTHGIVAVGKFSFCKGFIFINNDESQIFMTNRMPKLSWAWWDRQPSCINLRKKSNAAVFVNRWRWLYSWWQPRSEAVN